MCAPAGAADTPEERLKSVEKALDENRAKEAELSRTAGELASEIDALRANSIAAAKAAQEHETALSALEVRLFQLAGEEQQKSAELTRESEQQAQLLMALERLARNPPEALALAPGDPLAALRGAILLGAAVPPIEGRARRLRQEIAALAVLRQQVADAQARHRKEGRALDDEQKRLADLIERKAVLQHQAQRGAEESSQRLAQLASQAADLQQLIDSLAEERKRQEQEAARKQQEEEARRAMEQQARLAEPRVDKPDERAIEATTPAMRVDPSKPKVIRPFASARGLLVYPASGRVTLRYGENDELGVVSKGLTLETRPAAQVVAPFDGRVVFAGPFRGYGHILIIEHGDGYHSLLAGLDRVEGIVGEWLVAGEPIGTMPADGANPRLYLELRHNGQPINPLPWLATHDEKVSG